MLGDCNRVLQFHKILCIQEEKLRGSKALWIVMGSSPACFLMLTEQPWLSCSQQPGEKNVPFLWRVLSWQIQCLSQRLLLNQVFCHLWLSLLHVLQQTSLELSLSPPSFSAGGFSLAVGVQISSSNVVSQNRQISLKAIPAIPGERNVVWRKRLNQCSKTDLSFLKSYTGSNVFSTQQSPPWFFKTENIFVL